MFCNSRHILILFSLFGPAPNIDVFKYLITSKSKFFCLVFLFFLVFFFNLQHNDMDAFLDDIGETKKLNAVDKNSCESEITLEDYEYAISTLCDNKSPGNDGLTAEFYKTFSTTFSQLLIGVYNESLQHGELCRSQRESVLTLIFKKGDRQLIKNYRPISITNIDYKIIAKILANRFHTVLPKLISQDQTAYIKGRTISQNIRLVQINTN